MSNYGVNGWSGGVRQSLTYNLKAGQMRGMGRVNVFPSNTTVINNNIFGNSCGMYDNCCDGSDGMSGFTKTMLGIGMGTSILGTILGFFGIGGGGGKSEGAGGTEKPKETPKETPKEPSKLEQAQNAIKGLGKEYSVSIDADGNITYKYTDKNGNEYTGKTLGELNQAILDGKNKPTEVKPESKPDETSVKPSEPETQELKDGTFTSAIDEALGSRSKIKGEVTNNTDGTVSIKGTNNTYTYEKGKKTVTYNGKSYTVYSLKGATNNKTGKAVPTIAQEYILINGQLVQPKDCKELAGLGTGSIKHRR